MMVHVFTLKNITTVYFINENKNNFKTDNLVDGSTQKIYNLKY